MLKDLTAPMRVSLLLDYESGLMVLPVRDCIVFQGNVHELLPDFVDLRF